MTTETLPLEVPTHSDLGITHIAWAFDMSKALCGKKLKGIVKDSEVECVVCLELEAAIKRELGL